MKKIIILTLFCSFFMTGVIWLIQLLHYPAFLLIEETQFLKFHQQHTNIMTMLVGPVMIVELSCSIYLAKNLDRFWIMQFLIVLLLWGLTFFVSVPLHNQLALGKNDVIINQLIMTNWPRTILWSLKSILILRKWFQEPFNETFTN
jgi:hypothetical protein